MFTYAELLLLSPKDVLNLKITGDKDTLENAVLALEEIFSDNSLENGRNIENWEKRNLWLLEKKSLFIRKQITAASFFDQLYSVNQFLKSENIPQERLLQFPTEKPEFLIEKITPKKPVKKKTKEDIWIVTDEEKLPINPIEWCLCA